jgi:two-component system NtrC family sensor kinase
MMRAGQTPLVTTNKEHCRMCYTCVRECPAKAIRIVDQQADVICERCIGCGNCVQVCSQQAKQVASATWPVEKLLSAKDPVAAIIAPSFPAEFPDVDARQMVGMLRKLGFDLVAEVSFGADLVATEYRHLLERHPDKRFIATSCPSIVGYVERYHPDLVDALAPIVSPMIAMARVLHKMHGDDLPIVFIGPCIAKKGEAASAPVEGDVDAALMFSELRDMLAERGITPDNVEPSDFDPPAGGLGGLFPISGGMLQAAQIDEDLAEGEVVAADGREEFVDALKEFESGDLNAQLLECLCCHGCIKGPGFTDESPLFRRRAHVSRYVKDRVASLDRNQWKRDVATYLECDLSRTFEPFDQRVATPTETEVTAALHRIGKDKPEDELNCGACGYGTCREHAIAYVRGLAESAMCLPHMVERLNKTIRELTVSNEQLASTQEALMQSEKLASMGQLAAGIAHEVNNPLGTVLMLAHILHDEMDSGDPRHEDLGLIVGEADRCKKIVSGLLHFARSNKVEAREVDLCQIIDEIAAAQRKLNGIDVVVEHAQQPLTAEIDHDQIVQVLSNLVSNAVSAIGAAGTLTLRTWCDGDDVCFAVQDTGIGIPPENMKKIFEPFFTTKKAGQGTGLGLAVIYGIVKMHHGDVSVNSNADPHAGPTGTTFTVRLPRERGQRRATVAVENYQDAL